MAKSWAMDRCAPAVGPSPVMTCRMESLTLLERERGRDGGPDPGELPLILASSEFELVGGDRGGSGGGGAGLDGEAAEPDDGETRLPVGRLPFPAICKSPGPLCCTPWEGCPGGDWIRFRLSTHPFPFAMGI